LNNNFIIISFALYKFWYPPVTKLFYILYIIIIINYNFNKKLTKIFYKYLLRDDRNDLQKYKPSISLKPKKKPRKEVLFQESNLLTLLGWRSSGAAAPQILAWPINKARRIVDKGMRPVPGNL